MLCGGHYRELDEVMKPWVYVAGPYTKPDPVHNTAKAVKMGTFLRQQGFIPIVPHLTMFWDYIDPAPYEEWLIYDLHLIDRCDVLLRLPGESSGADKEVEYALNHGMQVYHDEGLLLLEWADKL